MDTISHSETGKSPWKMLHASRQKRAFYDKKCKFCIFFFRGHFWDTLKNSGV